MQKLAPIENAFPLAGFVIFSLFVPHRADAAPFTRVYVFGDSLSDTGNLYALSGGTIPLSPPYAGKLSNGPLWVEYLRQSLGLPAEGETNFALVGSTTGDTNTTIPGRGGIQQQVTGFLTTSPAAPNALYILWGGSNDYLGGGSLDPSIPVGNIATSILSLHNAGARDFLVPNLPNLGGLPGTRSTPAATTLGLLSIAHNTLLASTLGTLSRTLRGSEIIPLDVFSLYNDTLDNPAKYGFTNVTDACLPTEPLGFPSGLPCDNPSGYLFWDAIHPTTGVHRSIGQLAAKALGIPEPSATLALIAFGTTAAVIRPAAKRK